MLTSVIRGPRCKVNACDIYPPLIISGLICLAGTKSKMSIKKREKNSSTKVHESNEVKVGVVKNVGQDV